MTFRPFTSAIPYPAFRTLDEARAWGIDVYRTLAEWEKPLKAMLTELRKLKGNALTAANAGTVNSGDATTDDVIEANRTRIGEIEAILVANGLAEEA